MSFIKTNHCRKTVFLGGNVLDQHYIRLILIHNTIYKFVDIGKCTECQYSVSQQYSVHAQWHQDIV